MRRLPIAVWVCGFVVLVCGARPALAQVADADSADAAPVTRAELQRLLEGHAEQLQTMQADLDKLKRFKFSGYVQARAEVGEASSDSVRTAGSPYAVTAANLTRFFIRRARLKLTYDSSPWSQAVLYVDGGQDRQIRLLEAYVTLMDPWSVNKDHQLTVGQFNVPFGWEIERSSATRELPERSRAENVLFSGERDRGVKLENQWTPKLKTSFAVLNGGGINSADFPTTDPTRGKDVTARARWSEGWLDVAASYYAGRHVTPLTGPDAQTEKSRLGADAQAYWQTPWLGGASLRGEWYAGREINPDSVRTLVVAPTSANPVRLLRAGANADHLASDMSGGYVMAVQNLGERFQLAARIDVYDPNVDVAHDQFRRWTFALHWFPEAYTRVTANYDAVTTEVAAGAGRFRDPKDNLWTFQLQHRF